jgi:hypothetical protein
VRVKAACIAALLALMAGCRAERTEVVVIVSAGDLQVPADLDALRVSVTDRTVGPALATRFEQTVPLCGATSSSECYALPLVLTLVPGEQRPRDPVTVDVEALRGSESVLRDEAVFTFRTGYSMRLDFILYGKCLGSDCAASQSACNADGQCQTLNPQPLIGEPHLDLGGAAVSDGAAGDGAAGPDDAGVPLDGPPATDDGGRGMDLQPPADLSGADQSGVDLLGADLAPVERACGSLQLDGMNASMLLAPHISTALTSFTAEAWVYLTGAPSGTVQILGSGSGVGSTSWTVTVDATRKPTFTVYTASATNYTLTFGTAVPLNQWTHVATQWSPALTTMNMFVSGVASVRTIPNLPPFDSNSRLVIGNSDPLTGTPQPFNGLIEEVRVSSVTRYGASGNTIVPPTRFTPDDKTVALYHLDEASGTTAIDSSPLANHGTLQGTAAFTGTCVPTRCGNLALTGGAAAATSSKFNAAGAFTVEAWLLPNVTGSSGTHNNTIVHLGADDAHLGFHLYMDANAIASFVTSCDGATPVFALDLSPMPNLKWVHLAGVFDGSKIQIYVNGAKNGEASVACSTVFQTNGLLQVARAGDLHGLLDELRLSKVARYTTTFTPAATFTADSDTVALYHFDEGSGLVAGDSASSTPVSLTLDSSNIALSPACN